ncbi:MAG: ferritin-like domain-containing protein [Cyanobacteriota bacterium]|jgi:bacterioferritin|nr:ferritin-like domain-containing protein [Cyanobacteriota bacterium]
MPAPPVHTRVLADLGRALSLELSAVQHYLTLAVLLDSWGDATAADRFRRETVEEMQHAERLVKRMVSLGVAPGASALQPARHASDLAGLLRHSLALEGELIAHYGEAVALCQRVGDSENQAFFQELWLEERQHGVGLDSWLSSLESPAEQPLPGVAV